LLRQPLDAHDDEPTREANRDGEGEKGREGHHRHHARDGESDVPIHLRDRLVDGHVDAPIVLRDRAGGEEHALPADGGLQGLGARPLAGEAIDILADRGADFPAWSDAIGEKAQPVMINDFEDGGRAKATKRKLAGVLLEGVRRD